MKLTKIALIVGAVTIGLVGCGGGGGGSTPVAENKEYTAIDNYLKGAQITLTCSDDTNSPYVAITGENGKASFPATVVPNNCSAEVTGIEGTVDIDEPSVAWTGTLKAPKGKQVANAFTTVYVLYQEAGVPENEIVDQIIANLDPSGSLGLTADTLFADFGSNAGEKKSKKLLKLSNATFHAMKSVVEQNPADLLSALQNAGKEVGNVVTDLVNQAEGAGTDLDTVKIVVVVKVNSDGSVTATGKLEELVKPTPTPTVEPTQEPTGTGTGTESGGGTGA